MEISPRVNTTVYILVTAAAVSSNEPPDAQNPGYARTVANVTLTRTVGMNASLAGCTSVWGSG